MATNNKCNDFDLIGGGFMKKNRSILAIILMLVLTMSLFSGCGSTTDEQDVTATDESTESTASNQSEKTASANSEEMTQSEDEPYLIGYNYFGSGAYSLAALANNSKVVIEAFGHEAMPMDDEFSVEKIIQDVENMIASGADGVIIWLPVESLYLTVVDICTEAEVPFVLNDKIPSTPEIKEALLSNPYFAGAVAPANGLYGESLADYALEMGWKTCIITSSPVGDASDTPRLEAFVEKFTAGGGEIVEELHADTVDGALVQIKDAIAAHGEVDVIYGTGSDFAINACTALEQYDYDTKVISSGLDKEALELFVDESSPLAMLNGDNWIAGYFSAIVLENYLDGTPLLDAEGNPVWIDDVMPFELSKNQYNLYLNYFMNEPMYMDEETRMMSGKYNPDFDYDAFMSVVDEFGFESRIRAKYAAGLISDEEMTAGGFELE